MISGSRPLLYPIMAMRMVRGIEQRTARIHVTDGTSRYRGRCSREATPRETLSRNAIRPMPRVSRNVKT